MSQTNMYSDCPKCKSTLQYPCGAKLVRCPSCHWITNTTAPQQLPCIECHTLLAFPPHSLYIRCPKCFTTIHIRDHQYKNELLSNKDTTNIMYKSYPNLAPFLRIDPHSIDNTNDNNDNTDNKNDDNDNDNDNANKSKENDIIHHDIITSITYEHDQQLNEIITQHPSIKGNMKYKWFDSELLNKEDDNSDDNDNDEELLTLPQLNRDNDSMDNNIGRKNEKRILTAFQCYCNEERSDIIKKNRSMSEIEISKQLAINWKKLNVDERQQYVEQAQSIVDELLDVSN
eukprot:267381_1